MERGRRDRSRSPIRDKDKERHGDRRDRDERGREPRSHGETSRGSLPRDKPRGDHRPRHPQEERRERPDRDLDRERTRDHDRHSRHDNRRNDRRANSQQQSAMEGRGGRVPRDDGQDSGRERPRNNRRQDKDQDRLRGQRRETRSGADRLGEYLASEGNNEEEGEVAAPTEKPNYELSGKLTEYTNTYKGVVIKYNEPPEARKPNTRWRLYPFKGEESLPVMYIHRQSAYLLGRQRHIADIPIDHPSCSKQHAILQYRLVNYEKPDGSKGRRVKPYVLDLDSANGTFLNNQKVEPRRYYELKERDVLKFGFSSREYVLLHEKSSVGEGEDDGRSGDSSGGESPPEES
ncbi:smad nuclear-interacting protein 1 [Nematostella vectensis]|nr:smad nuclear-interacting protein 1 [Nematostella vectensis]